jgi:tRNA (guanine26-N2/guanine27-N2)-dimethyltransferase
MLRSALSKLPNRMTESILTEGSARIHVPQAVAGQIKESFYNPVQEYNRDLSIVALRTWSDLYAHEKREVWSKKRGNKKRKLADGQAQDAASAVVEPPALHKFTVFEGLAATGLRSIRYAKEIPLLKFASSFLLTPTSLWAVSEPSLPMI